MPDIEIELDDKIAHELELKSKKYKFNSLEEYLSRIVHDELDLLRCKL